jgi:hypothetical protein
MVRRSGDAEQEPGRGIGTGSGLGTEAGASLGDRTIAGSLLTREVEPDV